MRDSIFISYSHKDHRFLEELQSMLKPLQRSGKVDPWDDTKIRASAKWQDEIDNALKNAKAAVLLVSKSFLDSDFIANHELPPLLKAAEQDGLKIFWVCLSNCLYNQTEIIDYQAIHDIKKPLKKMTPGDRDDVWKKISEELEKVPSIPPLYLGPSSTDIGMMGQTNDVKQSALGLATPRRMDVGIYSANCIIEPCLRKTAQDLIVVILQQSDAATRRLAVRFGLDDGQIAECCQRVADKALDKSPDELFKIALHEQKALLDDRDEQGSNAIAQLVLAVLPVRHESGDVESVRAHRLETGKLVELHASHKTIAELIMARADGRPAAYVRPHDLNEFTGGKACLARVPEGGRDPSGKQFQRDFTEDLAYTFESVINAQFENKFSDYLRRKLKILNDSSDDDEDLDVWINEGLRLHAEWQARQFLAAGSSYTHYFLIETPPGLTDADRDAQNAVLLRLKARFPEIVFLRLAPFSRKELLPYSQLRALLYANRETD
jgi:ribosomal protein S18